MGFHHGVGHGGLPFHGAGGEDGQSPIIRDVAQIVGEIALPLPTKAGDPMRWDAIKSGRGKPKALQKLQSIQHTVHISRVLAHLELAQPNEPADATFHGFGQQCIEFSPHCDIKAFCDAGLDPAFGGN